MDREIRNAKADGLERLLTFCYAICMFTLVIDKRRSTVFPSDMIGDFAGMRDDDNH